MKGFERLNPLSAALYYLCVLGLSMFSMNPLMLVISLFCAVLTCIADGTVKARGHLFALILFIVAAVLNPLIVHKGATVLFYFNDRPFTMEAAVYGVTAAVMLTAALYWLRSLSRVFTADKVMYLFGRISPKLALLISMTLRYVGLFKYRFRRIRDAQRALGLYDDGNLIDAVRGNARVLSILITWTLENGIVTAESMEGRGYGSGRRTSYAPYRLHGTDAVFMLLTALLTAIAVAGTAHTSAVFYPELNFDLLNPWGIAGTAAFSLLSLLPLILNAKEAIRWRILSSKI